MIPFAWPFVALSGLVLLFVLALRLHTSYAERLASEIRLDKVRAEQAERHRAELFELVGDATKAVADLKSRVEQAEGRIRELSMRG